MAQAFPHKVINQPGIRRDGTILEGNQWSAGQWVRFDRNRPRKMRGYRSISKLLNNPSRQLTSQTSSGSSYIHSGHVAGIDAFTVSSTASVSSTTTRTPAGFTQDPNITWQFSTIYDPTSGLQQLIGVATYSQLDPTNTTVGNGALNAMTGNTSNIFNGGVYLGTALTTMALAPNGSGSKTESATTTGVSGGVCVLNPYTILYGANGYFAWSTPTAPLDFRGAGSGSNNITAQKIIRGLPLRGGAGYSPAGLFWSIDSLIRATYVGGTTIWQWDTLSDEISLLNANCVVQSDGLFYWVGADGRFYLYNGVIQEIPNDLNLNWFFDGRNPAYDGKAYAFRNPRWGEIWFCYARGTATEPSHAVIYNYRKKTWYDTKLPVTGRSMATLGDTSLGILMSDATINTSSAYTLWQHEVGVDAVDGTSVNAIDAFIETTPITLFTGDQPSFAGLSASILESDFVFNGNLTVTVRGQASANSPNIDSVPYVITASPTTAATQVTPIKEMRRQMSLRFESNVAGGDFQLGDCWLHISKDSARMTT